MATFSRAEILAGLQRLGELAQKKGMTTADETQSYAYDALDRLTGWTLNGATENYGYDSVTGNLSNKAGTAYTYDSIHKHAVASLSNGNSYDYDANGNQITRHVGSDTFNLAYDAENRLIEVKKNNAVIAQFVYDGDGKRVKSIEDGKTILFVANGFEVNITTGEVSKYYFAGAQRIAVRKYIIPQTTELNYLLSDHLGSTSLVTSDTGSLISETRYKAWGEVRYATSTTSSLPVRYTYTSQFSHMDDPITPETEGFGLMFYNARFYDPSLSRFTSADTIVPGGVQGLDRYAYVRNNPINFIDPTGHEECNEEFGCDISAKDQIKISIEEKYKVKIAGKWNADELGYLRNALIKMAEYLGGVNNLNEAFLDAAQSYDSNATGIIIRRVSSPRWNSGDGASVAAWCEGGKGNCKYKNTIVVADDAFTKGYQFGPGFGKGRGRASYPRTGLNLGQAIQFTFAHEFTHVLADANPASLSDYKNTHTGSMLPAGSWEENMANEVARTVVTNNDFPTVFTVSAQTQESGYWNYP